MNLSIDIFKYMVTYFVLRLNVYASDDVGLTRADGSNKVLQIYTMRTVQGYTRLFCAHSHDMINCVLD